MGGEDRGADPERQHEEGFSSLAAHYSYWEDFKDIHTQIHSKLLWGEAQAKILSEISLDELYNAARVGMPREGSRKTQLVPRHPLHHLGILQ